MSRAKWSVPVPECECCVCVILHAPFLRYRSAMTEGPPLTTLLISGRSSAKLLSSIPQNLLRPEWSVFKYNILFPIRVADCELTNCSWSASEMDEQRNVDEPVRSKARNQPLYSRRSTQYHNCYNSPRSLSTERADLDYLSPRSLIKYT